jgi:hypothetical protein
MPELRAAYADYHFHFWQGRPGHWKSLLTAHVARRIAAAHPEMFQALGYKCDPDFKLTPAQADLNWYRLQFESVWQHMEIERSNHNATRKALQEDRSRLVTIEQTLAEAQAKAALAERETEFARQEAARLSTQHAALSLACRALREELGADLAQVTGIEGLGPVSIGIARKLNDVARRYPRLSGAVKQLMRRERKPPATLPIASGTSLRPRSPGIASNKAAS